MNWKKTLIAAATWKRYHAFIKDTQYPEQAKERLWAKETWPLLKKATFWKGFLNEHPEPSLDDFEISAYDDYHATLLAAMNSKQQPCNGEEIIYWSETSATSGARKFFPISKLFIKQFQRTMSPFLHSLTQRFPKLFTHKIVYLVSMQPCEKSSSGIDIGMISNFNYRHLPHLIKKLYALPYDVFANAQTFQQWAPVYAMAQDLSAIFAVTPLMIDLFYKNCRDQFGFLLPYLLGEKSLPPHLPRIIVSSQRRAYLKQINPHHISTYQTLWPALQFACCWSSGPFSDLAQQLGTVLGKNIPVIDGTYSATEGWMTVPMDNNIPGGVLHPGAHIVEFIEQGQELKKSNLIQSWDLQPDKRYEVFLTTAMGFVRYRLKDIIECTGFYNRSPQIRFCHKVEVLKLDYCSVTEQELRTMLRQVNFKMELHWYFARNNIGNQLFLITDQEAHVSQELLQQMNEAMIAISESYKHFIQTNDLLPLGWITLPREQLVKTIHAQTKPKLISQTIIKKEPGKHEYNS